MNEENQRLDGQKEWAGHLPPLKKVVWVRSGGYRLLAYRDEKEVWRCVGNGEELKRVTEVEWPDRGG